MHGFEHPNIYRAIHIEGVDYTPDFLSHLVVFALKLRNNGISDHDIVVHLSEFIAGNFYGFGTQGHSTLYEELNTYMVAISWTLFEKSKTLPDQLYSVFSKNTESWVDKTKHYVGSFLPLSSLAPSTKSIARISENEDEEEARGHLSLQNITNGFAAPTKLNPYYLPWVMSQLLHDPRIKRNKKLSEELKGLQKMFVEWRPLRTAEKELKYRLEPLKAKL
jgi:hypothetical protein